MNFVARPRISRGRRGGELSRWRIKGSGGSCARALGSSACDQRSSGPLMCDQMPRKSNDTPADAPQPITVEHLRRAADSWRDLSDPVLMAKACDEPAASDVQPPKNAPRRFGQLQNLSVPDTLDDSLPDTELAAGEGDPPSYPPGGHPVSRRQYVTVTQCLRISSLRRPAPESRAATWVSTWALTSLPRLSPGPTPIRTVRGAPAGDLGALMSSRIFARIGSSHVFPDYSHRVTDRCIWGPTSYASKAGSP